MAVQNILGIPTPFGATYGGTGVADPTAHAVIIAEGSDPVSTVVLGAGEVLIGVDGADPVAATLTPGSGINITSIDGSITISNSAIASSWTFVAGTTQALAVNQKYVATNAAQTTFTLPSTAAQGSVIELTSTQNTYVIAQNAGQTISYEGVSTTTGATGTYTTNVEGAYTSLLCTTANTDFIVLVGGGLPDLA